MSNATDDPVPRDVLALVILHGLLSAGGPASRFQDDSLIQNYADLAYSFADAMKKRSAQ